MQSASETIYIEGVRFTLVKEAPAGAWASELARKRAAEERAAEERADGTDRVTPAEVWEAHLSAARLQELVMLCSQGRPLSLNGFKGARSALVRRYWVAPLPAPQDGEGGSALLHVRLTLGE